MIVRDLYLRQFRNIEEAYFEPTPGINLLVGDNGQGKTSFLEALSYLSTLRSFRQAKNDEVIRWENSDSRIQCRIAPEDDSSDEWASELRLQFQFKDELKTRAAKAAFINGKTYRSTTQYLSQRFGQVELGFHSVVFNPSDHDLVRGEPALRRSYLDRVLAAEDVEYLELSKQYQRVLQQRNTLLKRQSEAPIARFQDVLMGFTEPLVSIGAKLTLKRLQWIQEINYSLSEVAWRIAPTQPELSLKYIAKIDPELGHFFSENDKLPSDHFTGQPALPSLEMLEKTFGNKLSSLYDAELRARVTLAGPHRDDWAFHFGRQLLRGHGSQGEVRSALLALKMTEIDHFQSVTGHRPILLLDDFSSELDRSRREFLLSSLIDTDLQVFVTTTEDRTDIGTRFWVSEGNIGRTGPGIASGDQDQSESISESNQQ